jgi:hypothetical protein
VTEWPASFRNVQVEQALVAGPTTVDIIGLRAEIPQ